MIAVKLSKGPFPKHAIMFNDYLRWAERNFSYDPVFMVEEYNAVHIGDAEAPNVFMRWTPSHGGAQSGYLCALFFEFADPVDLNDFL